MCLFEKKNPVHSPASLTRARLTNSAPRRETTICMPFSSSVRVSSCRPSRFSSVCENFIVIVTCGCCSHGAVRRLWAGRLPNNATPHRGVATTKDSRKQAAHLFALEDALDTNGHGRGAMRNFVRFGASDYLRKRMFQDAEKLVSHFHFRPQIRLQTLHPLKVRNNYATGVAQNVRDHEDFVPAFFQNQVCLRRSRTIGGFGKDTAFELAGVLSVNYAIDCCRHQDIARHREEFVRIDMMVLVEGPQGPFLKNVLFGGLD